MLIGHEWHQTFHRILASPAAEMLAVAAVLGIVVFSLFGADAFPPHDAMVVFGPR